MTPAGPPDPLDAPLLARWAAFRSTHRPFTIPGHQGLAGALDARLGALLDSDVPLHGGLDTVSLAADALGEAERRAARLWGADVARFSTGGSTHGNQAVALALGSPGDEVLVSRQAHRSVLLGLVLAGLRPVWLPVTADPRWALPAGVEVAALRRALDEHPRAVGVLLTEPGYLGVGSDLPALVELAHSRDVPVVVDAAWAAHLGFTPGTRHALQVGADAVVTSAHKTLPAYSQACLVLATTGRLDPDRLARAFEASHTTSPAGSVLASIDAARAVLEQRGTELLGAAAATAAGARDRLRRIPGLVLPGPEDFPDGRCDPLKLVLLLPGTGADGIAVERDLLAQGLTVEMADRDTVVPILTLVDGPAQLAPLLDALEDALARHRGAPRGFRPPLLADADAVLDPRTAFFAAQHAVGWQDAVGRVCAEVVAPYPPGVPVLVPGERIERATLDSLRALAAEGTRVAYAADPTLDTVRVVDDRVAEPSMSQ